MSVTIMMGTFNGMMYLEQQLMSIENQTFKDWRLIVSDDGSTDGTITILETFRDRWGDGRLLIKKGPQKGFCQNFLSMAIDPDVIGDYFAFADQDDVWLPHKLENAVTRLSTNEKNDTPEMLCTRTIYVDKNLKPIGISPLFVYPETFRNALVQSIAGGNTMVFNYAAKKLLELVAIVDVVSHDWWVYQLITGAGGIVQYDSNPTILYRQHPASIVGGKTSLFGQFRRLVMLMKGRFKEWNDINLAALSKSKKYLNRDARSTLELFIRLRDCDSVMQRMRILEVCGLYRQTWRETLTLIVAAILKKI